MVVTSVLVSGVVTHSVLVLVLVLVMIVSIVSRFLRGRFVYRVTHGLSL